MVVLILWIYAAQAIFITSAVTVWVIQDCEYEGFCRIEHVCLDSREDMEAGGWWEYYVCKKEVQKDVAFKAYLLENLKKFLIGGFLWTLIYVLLWAERKWKKLEWEQWLENNIASFPYCLDKLLRDESEGIKNALWYGEERWKDRLTMLEKYEESLVVKEVYKLRESSQDPHDKKLDLTAYPILSKYDPKKIEAKVRSLIKNWFAENEAQALQNLEIDMRMAEME